MIMFFKEFFYLPKGDRHVLLLLMIFIVIAVVVLYVVGDNNRKTDISQQDSVQLARTRRYQNTCKSKSYEKQLYYAVEGKKPELFAFDPNTADSSQFLRLGLSPWQVRNIYKYRASGGIYRKPSDFAKLYGLTKGQYDRMKPYIRISEDYQPASEFVAKSTLRDTLKYPVKIKQTERIILNEADTDLLKKVPGIGSAYAHAIINYRNRLGGYYKVEQLMEIDGFPEESLDYFIIHHSKIIKININKLTVNQMRRHPYINFYQAKAISDYRRIKGPIKSLHDLWLLKEFPKEEIDRIEPYVEY